MQQLARGDVGSPLISLTAGQSDSVQFADFQESVTIITRGGDLWFTVDGSVPAVGGVKSYFLPNEGGLAATTVEEGQIRIVNLLAVTSVTVRVQRG